MNLEIIFQIVNLIALVSWVILILFPHKKNVIPFLRIVVIGFLMGLSYSVFIAFGLKEGEGNFSSLAGVKSLFTNNYAVLAGWIHYLAFDLFLGTWETVDAKENNIPRFLLIPCLLLTFYVGPIGYLVYTLIKIVKKRG